MNQPPENNQDPQAIRSEIDETRRRMDHTIDALGERFNPRHLADEALGYFRKQSQNGNMTKFKNKLSSSADTAAHSVIDTVKSNPIPAALIGAGIAYYFYARNRSDGMEYGYTEDGYRRDYLYEDPYSGSAGGSAAFEKPGVGERVREKAGELKERSSEALHQAGEKLHETGERVRERAQMVADRARERANQVRNRSREMYQRGREKVATSVNEHPLESGLMVLALGLIAGIALPTSERVRQRIAPQARQLRERSREFVEKGRVVVRSATDAAKHEAEAQGLTGNGGQQGNASGGGQQNSGNREQELFGRQQTGSNVSQPITP